ncbi:hypothetical protein FSP39_021334 [Pinctada imbricata]|uniref:G-protein coupled receptors family 1 profile domain-containing protein n=1 Tax=Pinctada imbricata TaxID=66713 RepID=A0AA89BZP8_PINIB|nr:hypothetical protein FSP39_021334 [Pinctada imbricata]
MGLIFTIPIIITSEKNLIFDFTIMMCNFNRYGDRAYILIFLCFCFIVPVVITAASYVKIQIYVWNQRREMSRHWNNGLAIQRFVHDLRSSKSNAMIFVMFLVLYFPFAVISIFETPDEFPEDLNEMGIFLCFANSCVNCFIYGALNRNMRHAFKETFYCNRICNRNVQHSDDLMTISDSRRRRRGNRIVPESQNS